MTYHHSTCAASLLPTSMYFVPTVVSGKPESMSTATMSSGAPVKMFSVSPGGSSGDLWLGHRFDIDNTTNRCRGLCPANSISFLWSIWVSSDFDSKQSAVGHRLSLILTFQLINPTGLGDFAFALLKEGSRHDIHIAVVGAVI